MIRQDNPDGAVRSQVDAETVQQSIDDLRTSLTVIYAYAQFVQRQGRQGEPLSHAEAEKRGQVIAGAAKNMINDLDTLEDVCEE